MYRSLSYEVLSSFFEKFFLMSFSRFMFLGTSSAVPRPGHRNVSAMMIQYSCGSITLVDCGEATQHQLMRSTVRMGNIDNVFLTHLHGDHCYGLFGLMHTLNMGGRTTPVNLFGPKGVQELVHTVFRLTGGWDAFELNITELEPEKLHSFDLKSPSHKGIIASVKACPMVHRVPAFGYVFKEPDQPLSLDGEKAKQLGATGPALGRLKSGHDVPLDDGTVIRSTDVTNPGRPARTIGIMQDTCDSSRAVPFMQGCDLLVHESTYDKSRYEQAIQYGHATSVMAAEIAKEVAAKNLVLTHFSSRYGANGENEILRTEAQVVLSGQDCEVLLAEDFMCIAGEEFREISSILKPDT